MLKDFENFHDKTVILADSLDLIVHKNLDSEEGNPPLKKHSFFGIIRSNEILNLCDIWRVRNPHKKLFTFWQKHLNGII